MYICRCVYMYIHIYIYIYIYIHKYCCYFGIMIYYISYYHDTFNINRRVCVECVLT